MRHAHDSTIRKGPFDHGVIDKIRAVSGFVIRTGGPDKSVSEKKSAASPQRHARMKETEPGAVRSFVRKRFYYRLLQELSVPRNQSRIVEKAEPFPVRKLQ